MDILGAGGMGLAPPSINPLKGSHYNFLEGSPAAIATLPRMKAPPAAAAPPIDPAASMRDGDGRNNELFHRALRIARGAATERELLQMIVEANLAFAEPLPPAEVGRLAESVWGYKSRGRLLVAGTEAVAGYAEPACCGGRRVL